MAALLQPTAPLHRTLHVLLLMHHVATVLVAGFASQGFRLDHQAPVLHSSICHQGLVQLERSLRKSHLDLLSLYHHATKRWYREDEIWRALPQRMQVASLRAFASLHYSACQKLQWPLRLHCSLLFLGKKTQEVHVHHRAKQMAHVFRFSTSCQIRLY